VSETDTEKSYLKKSKINPQRLTIDNTHIFNGVGMQDGIFDRNGNGNPLDDWAIGNSHAVMATSSSGVTFKYPSDKVIDLSTFLNTYSIDGSGFNLYRLSAGNGIPFLWKDLFKGEYSVNDGKVIDTLVQALREKRFYIWFTLFNWEIPYDSKSYDNNMWPVQQDVLRQYIRYIIARYGAFVSIWEISNEARPTQTGIKFVVDEIKKRDFELRPISTNFEMPDSDSINIISPHWYSSEDQKVSDLAISEIIRRYDKYHKPIIFGEVGNAFASWDTFSALRLRIHTWVSFIQGALVIFWNQSDDKTYHNITYSNGNIFLGEEERKYITIFRKFVNNIDLTAKPFVLETNNSGVRSYGLASDKEVIGYFYHFSDQSDNVTFNVNLDVAKEGTVTWADPSTGEVLQSNNIHQGLQEIISPPFRTDVALKVIYASD
jgi:hypothetical protein